MCVLMIITRSQCVHKPLCPLIYSRQVAQVKLLPLDCIGFASFIANTVNTTVIILFNGEFSDKWPLINVLKFFDLTHEFLITSFYHFHLAAIKAWEWPCLWLSLLKGRFNNTKQIFNTLSSMPIPIRIPIDS